MCGLNFFTYFSEQFAANSVFAVYPIADFRCIETVLFIQARNSVVVIVGEEIAFLLHFFPLRHFTRPLMYK